MSFFKEVIAKLIQAAFEGHTSFSVADNTAIGDNPIRVLKLDAVPAGDNVLISLSWEGGDKVFEKQLSSEEAQHQFELISTDLAEAVSLTQKGEYDAAKKVMEQLTQKYAENTGEIVETNLPTLNHTQASTEFDGLWKQAKVSLRNIFPSGTVQQLEFETTEELKEYQGSSQDHVPLWDKAKGQNPAGEGEGQENSDLLAPGNMSYEDAEKQKEKEHKNIDKQIKEQVKTEVESAMIEKAATVFGPDQVELVKVLKKNGRNWDEIKKILVKDFGFDKDATTIFVDEQRQAAEGTPPEADKETEELNPMAPPKDLVPDSAHDELLKDIEDKKEDIKPEVPGKEKGLSPEDIMDIPEDKPAEEPIKDESSLTEISRADNSEIRKAAMLAFDVFLNGKEIDTVFYNETGDPNRDATEDEVYRSLVNHDGYDPAIEVKLSTRADELVPPMGKPKMAQKKIAINPLEVAPPVAEKPTAEDMPAEDVVPMEPSQDSTHQAPQKGDRVFVSSDLGSEKAGFEGKFVSDYASKGTKFSIIETDNGELIDVESHRLSTVSPTEKLPEPAVAPEIESAAMDPEIAVTPKQNDLYSSLEDIKAEVTKLAAQILEIEAAPGDAPAEAPKAPATTLKDVKITPDKIDKEKAVPATPEQSQLIAKLESIEASLGQLELARENVKAQLDAEMKKIDQEGGRAALEAEYKGEIEKLGVSIELVSTQLVKYNGMFISFKQEEKTIEVKPNYKDLMSRVYEKFEGVEKYVQQVMNGMQSLAKDVTTRTVTRWPEKRSELGKAASLHDELAQMNAELLQALKLLSEPIA